MSGFSKYNFPLTNKSDGGNWFAVATPEGKSRKEKKKMLERAAQLSDAMTNFFCPWVFIHFNAIIIRDERVHHYLYLYLFNQLNYLYPYLYSEWAGLKPEVVVVWPEMGGAYIAVLF